MQLVLQAEAKMAVFEDQELRIDYLKQLVSYVETWKKDLEDLQEECHG